MEIQDIKSRLTIAQVLHYYHLKPDKNLRLCCPFHDDKTPSMQVYYKTHTAFCFSSNCKTHGKAVDALDFIMLMENITKHEAIKKAVEMIGGETKPMDELTKAAVLTKMFTYFKNAIANSPQAKEYIKSRHLDHEKMEIGYNSGQFHHGTRRDEDMIKSCIKYGLLLDLNTKGRTGEAAYSPFGKWSIVFALRNQVNQISGLYFRSTLAEKEQRHFYLKDRQGLYPHYPKAETKKLILTESIIDAASLMMQENIKNQYEILSLYGTNGLTEEHTKAIKELKEINEIIFFLNGDEPGVKAVQKYAPMLQSEIPGVKISNVEVPQNEDINSLLDSHSEEILLHLINSRKECNFLFSSEVERLDTQLFFSNENKKAEEVKEAEEVLLVVSEAEANTASQPSEVSKPKGLDTQNPYNLRYESEAAQYQIKGFKIDQMDSLKITIQITTSFNPQSSSL
jgi:DNA primase